MASSTLRTKKDGTKVYYIRATDGRGRRLSVTWEVPKGYSKNAEQRELERRKGELDARFKAGEICTKSEQLERDQEAAAAAARIETVEQYIKQVFMPAKEISISEQYRSTLTWAFTNYVIPAIGKLKITDVGPADLQAILINIQAAGKPAVVDQVNSALHGLFKMAYKTEVIERNPMDKVEKPKQRKDIKKEPETKAFTAEEIITIVKYLNAEPLKWKVCIRLLIDTGMRRGECCALRWKDIDFKNDKLTVAGNIGYTPDKGVYRDATKSGHTRTIDLDPELVAMLTLYKEEQKAELKKRAKRQNLISENTYDIKAAEMLSPEYVFLARGSYTAPMMPDAINRFLEKFGEKHNISDIHPHKFRHTQASIAITNGADIVSVSEKLGHADTAITLRMYSHANEESIAKASNIFRDAIKQKQQKKTESGS